MVVVVVVVVVVAVVVVGVVGVVQYHGFAFPQLMGSQEWPPHRTVHILLPKMYIFWIFLECV